MTPDQLAKIYVDTVTNSKGEKLARLWDDIGFKQTFDPQSSYERKSMLEDRITSVHKRYDAATQLFQKVYYNPALLEEDEVQLRQAFLSANSSNEKLLSAHKWGAFAVYWPLLYVVSKRVRGYSLLGLTGLYYASYRWE